MKLLSSPFYSPAGQTQPLLFEAIVVVRVVVVVASSCSYNEHYTAPPNNQETYVSA